MKLLTPNARRSGATDPHLFQPLEGRSLFGVSPFPALNLMEDRTNPVLQMITDRGDIFIELLANTAPQTVAAFLGFIDRASGASQTFFNDVRPGVTLTGGNWFILDPDQNGMFTPDTLNQFSIPLGPVSEGGRPNTRRTIATTHTGAGPSGPGFLVFNLDDNSATEPTNEFIVFARVLDDPSWTVVQQIAALPPVSFDSAPNIHPDARQRLTSVPAAHQYHPGDPVSTNLVVRAHDTFLVKAPGADDYYHHTIRSAEGFTGSTINEFIPIENPNDAPVSYEIRARYERLPGTTGLLRDDLVARGVLAPHSRSGVTVSTTENWSDPARAAVLAGTPYSLELRSTLPVAANMSHYDFFAGTGEAFVDTLDTAWYFGQVVNNDQTHDFLVWHNPSDTDAAITVTLTPDFGGLPFQLLTTTTARFRRGGVNLHDHPNLVDGHFSVTITSSVPIIASLSHYATPVLSPPAEGFSSLGQPGPASRVGVVPIAFQRGADSVLQMGELTLSFFNTGTNPAVVSLDFYASGTSTPALAILAAATVQPGARSSVTYHRSDLPDTAFLTLLYTATEPVYVSHSLLRPEDSYSAPVAIAASTDIHFAEGFTDPARTAPSILEENVAIYNPNIASLGVPNLPASVTFTFRYTDGFTFTIDHALVAGGAFNLSISSLPQIIDQANQHARFYYSVEVSADLPIIAQMLHTDIRLGGPSQSTGGFTTLGTPLAPLVRLDELGPG